MTKDNQAEFWPGGKWDQDSAWSAADALGIHRHLQPHLTRALLEIYAPGLSLRYRVRLGVGVVCTSGSRFWCCPQSEQVLLCFRVIWRGPLVKGTHWMSLIMMPGDGVRFQCEAATWGFRHVSHAQTVPLAPSITFLEIPK